MKIPKEHSLKCPARGQEIDMRDLSQVFYHDGIQCVQKKPVKPVPYSGWRKKGEKKKNPPPGWN